MREIKFRAWKKSESRYVLWNELLSNPVKLRDALEGILYETIEQFTGLTDKNGKEIYEGDIAQSGTEEIYRDVCEWDDKGCRFIWVSLPDRDIVEYIDEYDEVTVIGDVHTTPELLKEK